MNFSDALAKTKDGLKLAREGWDPSQHLNIVIGSDGQSMLALTETRTDIMAWVPTMKDLFADDWKVMIDE